MSNNFASEFMPWSLFALTDDDIAALGTLAKSSILCEPDARMIDLSRSEIRAGRRIALSLKTTSGGVYKGLCVFGRESPSPAGDKALAMHILSLDDYPTNHHKHRSTVDEATGLALLGEVRRFCMTHGYTRIHCFVPPDPDRLSFLTQYGFEPEGVSFAGSQRNYALTLHLASTYTGDPYDGSHLLNWLAKQLRLERSQTTDTFMEGYLPLDRVNSDLSDTALGRSKLPISLELNAATTGRDYLRIGIKLGDRIVSTTSLSFDELRAISGTKRLDMTLWPPPEEGASIAVEIRADLFSRFDESRENAFFDSGSYGTLLEYGISHQVTPTIFFVDFATTGSNPRLIGVARVKSVHRGMPDELWNNWGSISSWSDLTEFTRYKAIKRKMTVIIFDKLRRVDVLGAGLPAIGHSWTYVPARQAYAIDRNLYS